MKKTIIAFLPIAAAFAFGVLQFSGFSQYTGGNPPTAGTPTPGALALKTTQGAQGEYLTDGQGKSLYVFDSDTAGQSNCNGMCAQVWPPLFASNGQKATASGDVNSAFLGTITRSDGSTQITYNGLPLYYYSLDQSPGDTKGQAINSFGAKWYLMMPNGSKLLPSTYTTPSGGYASGGYGGMAYTSTCGANGLCCDLFGNCHNGGFTCDQLGRCCDIFGHCFNNSADCDSSGHCCDSQGHCFDNGFACDSNAHCCDGLGQCFDNGQAGFSCDSQAQCCDPSGTCFNFGAGGGSGCGIFSCDMNGHCCDSCGQCYSKPAGPGPSGAPGPNPSPTRTFTPTPGPTPTSSRPPAPGGNPTGPGNVPSTPTSVPTNRPSNRS
jgi:predicted lipoprotein with Yx(FWY)xxD motif